MSRSGNNIGKFCSNNALDKPFDMYSHDGTAKVNFKSDNYTTGNGFSFQYRLRNKTADPLVGSSNKCNYFGDMSTVYFSNKWPSEYSEVHYCRLRQEMIEQQNLRISIMDIDFHSTKTCQEYIEVRESETKYSDYWKIKRFTSGVSGKLCRQKPHQFYIAKRKYVYFMIENLIGNSSHRGYLIGYKIYKVDEDKIDNGELAGTIFSISFFACGFLIQFMFLTNYIRSLIKRRILKKESAQENATAFVIHNSTSNNSNVAESPPEMTSTSNPAYPTQQVQQAPVPSAPNPAHQPTFPFQEISVPSASCLGYYSEPYQQMPFNTLVNPRFSQGENMKPEHSQYGLDNCVQPYSIPNEPLNISTFEAPPPYRE
ncbi:uncharacterized protein LOC135682365 isoform X2 [Rhopilema esculentum]|uniref:uncharacterized protein LOC135682365 isoform X2 n=1 Tax=Rhopilema esculentum TaxID=499914 RepID=UPI0031D06204